MPHPNKITSIDSEKLEEMYWSGKMSQSEIAEHFGVDQKTISRRMQEWDIPTRDRSVDLDCDRLEQLYVDEGLTQYEIADEVNCTQTHVSTLMRDCDIYTNRRLYEQPASFWHHPREGYELVGTKYKGTRYYTPVHRLVMVAHHGFEALEGMVVHHKNGVPWDNRPSNLKIMTPGEHNEHHESELVWDEDSLAFVPAGEL